MPANIVLYEAQPIGVEEIIGLIFGLKCVLAKVVKSCIHCNYVRCAILTV